VRAILPVIATTIATVEKTFEEEDMAVGEEEEVDE
jgi:hypothetical protein